MILPVLVAALLSFASPCTGFDDLEHLESPAVVQPWTGRVPACQRCGSEAEGRSGSAPSAARRRRVDRRCRRSERLSPCSSATSPARLRSARPSTRNDCESCSPATSSACGQSSSCTAGRVVRGAAARRKAHRGGRRASAGAGVLRAEGEPRVGRARTGTAPRDPAGALLAAAASWPHRARYSSRSFRIGARA
jgi:hypothetical protein